MFCACWVIAGRQDQAGNSQQAWDADLMMVECWASVVWNNIQTTLFECLVFDDMQSLSVKVWDLACMENMKIKW